MASMLQKLSDDQLSSRMKRLEQEMMDAALHPSWPYINEIPGYVAACDEYDCLENEWLRRTYNL